MTDMDQKQLDQYLRGEKPVLMEFWAPWCVYCRRLAPALEQIAAEFADTVVFGKVNIDDQPGMAAQAGIEVVPTLVLYRAGKASATLTAPTSGAKIQAFLRENLE